jgi:hypothetical protein
VICIENATLFIFFVLICGLVVMYYLLNRKMENIFEKSKKNSGLYGSPLPSTQIVQGVIPIPNSISTRNNEFMDLLSPPFKDGVYHPRDSSDIRGLPPPAVIPINIRTQGGNAFSGYNQVGILTRSNQSDMILPLFGKIHISGRNKWNYYTVSNTGNINTKLPVSLKGRSCTGETGCDEIYNGDVVYVEGYKDTFNATIYENGGMAYIPYI